MDKITINIPEGYYWGGEFRQVEYGENYLNFRPNGEIYVVCWENSTRTAGKFYILYKIETYRPAVIEDFIPLLRGERVIVHYLNIAGKYSQVEITSVAAYNAPRIFRNSTDDSFALNDFYIRE